MGEKETVIVQMGRDVIGNHKVDSDTFARAMKLFGHRGVTDIVSLMGNYAATTMLLNVADQHVRPKDKALLPSREGGPIRLLRSLRADQISCGARRCEQLEKIILPEPRKVVGLCLWSASGIGM